MKRLTLVLLVSSAFAAACGQRLVDFYNDHDDGGTLADLAGLDMTGPDMHVGDLGGDDLLAANDGSTTDGFAGDDIGLASAPDMNLPCHALSLPGISNTSVPIVTAGPSNPDYYNPTGAVTVEAWVYPTAQATPSVIVAHTGAPADSKASYALGTDAAGHLVFAISSDGSTFVVATSTGTVPLNAWTHVAGEFAPGLSSALGGAISTWIAGTKDGTMTTPLLFAVNNVTTPLAIGAFSTAVSASTTASARQPFIGYMHDVRLSNVARYSATFTPARTLANDASTLALFHLGDPVGTFSAADSSTHAVPGTLLDGAAFTNLGNNVCP